MWVHSDGVLKMACLICKGEAKTIDPLGGDYQDRECNDCGRYRISRSLLLELEAKKQRLDIDQTRLWLAINRKSGDIPILSTFEAYKNHLMLG